MDFPAKNLKGFCTQTKKDYMENLNTPEILIENIESKELAMS